MVVARSHERIVSQDVDTANISQYLPSRDVAGANIAGGYISMKLFLLFDEDNAATRAAIAALRTWAVGSGWELQCTCASALKLKPCLGCFGCWVKTPGACIIHDDDGAAFTEEYARSDATMILTKIPYGSYSPAVKRALDRGLAILLPFFEIHRGEMHHVQRYAGKRRLLHVPYGEHDAEEFDTFAELARAHCDNVESPPAATQIDYQGDAEALVAWTAKELAR
jgi:hypothetical protein